MSAVNRHFNYIYHAHLRQHGIGTS